MFLTPSDIETLTGYKRASRQILWLQENGIRHLVNGHGKPVIDRNDLRPTEAPRVREPDVCLSGVFKWAVRKGWTEVNPCLEVQKHSEPPRERYIEDHELERLLSAAGVCVFAHFPRIPVYIPI